MDAGAMEHLVVEVAEKVRHRFYGKYRATVADNDDPKGIGRIRANVPSVLDDKTSPWALPCVAFTGDDQGQYAIPPVGAGVWIEFEEGDPALPIWTGGFWGSEQPPKTNAGSAPTPPVKVLKSETGLMVSMNDDSKTLDVSDADGKNLLKLEVNAGKVTLKAASTVVVEAPQIQLVENSTHPVVFGDELLNYLTQLVTMLQTHTHPGELAAGFIPVTPMVPGVAFPQPTPSLVSKKVTSG